ncbi:MAG: response regulator transcription factor [Chlorobi bacterium]|nr:response regulator transcription factor [Chlorobiota bacterium]
MGERKRHKLLIVDDEPDISGLIVFNAEQAGYAVEAVYSGEDALKKARLEPPDLIVLDLMLPGIDGLDVCRILKGDEKTSDIPILMLTAKGTEEDIIRGLELGADDYVTKPFSPLVLFARIKSVLRRKQSEIPDKTDNITFEEIVLDPGRRKVKVNGNEIELTYSEFEILHFLLRRPGWVFTRNEIVNNIRGDNYLVTERSVDVQIVGLRKKMGEGAKYIETVRGVGYRLKEK